MKEPPEQKARRCALLAGVFAVLVPVALVGGAIAGWRLGRALP